jgi:predicted nucleic acid-binding protein
MFRLAPRDAERIVTRLRRRLKVAALSVKDYREAITMAVDRGLTGPVFYDVLHAQAARKAGAQRIATLNTADFRRIWTPSQIIEP